jgi:hypothetical protein
MDDYLRGVRTGDPVMDAALEKFIARTKSDGKNRPGTKK